MGNKLIQEKFEIFLAAKKTNTRKVAKEIGVDYAALYYNVKNSFTQERLIQLTELFPDLDLNWLLRDSVPKEPIIYFDYTNGSSIRLMEFVNREVEAIEKSLANLSQFRHKTSDN